MQLYAGYCLALVVLMACNQPQKPTFVFTGKKDTAVTVDPQHIPAPITDTNGRYTSINTGTTTPTQVLTFARSLIGTPYKYGSTNPKQGFDCSGFITYVFNHFNIAVPRSSVDFTWVKHQIDLKDAQTGDLILFTGTDSTKRVVGHMGILIAKPDAGLQFIHSTSGKAYGVTETPLNAYYMGRYLKTLRIFPKNN